jgi:hypothetical protein
MLVESMFLMNSIHALVSTFGSNVVLYYPIHYIIWLFGTIDIVSYTNDLIVEFFQ